MTDIYFNMNRLYQIAIKKDDKSFSELKNFMIEQNKRMYSGNKPVYDKIDHMLTTMEGVLSPFEKQKRADYMILALKELEELKDMLKKNKTEV